ncbi:hypothetical protein [Streptomyces olivochromogenes]|uniref:Uncharacterized protein n=1 Tax=Streptomyces olivochromogenes TaxID=1963 RepID=A0A250VSG1_STROL|nr:hypothetical protein [Streptomyces olivochromogenes]GAX57034.1 hypothetical protein SO3561_08604 [Streptomyces olivochromogenes]
MIFFQLVGIGVQFCVSQLVQTRLGFAGLVVFTMALVGVKAEHPRLVRWSAGALAGLFVLLTLRLQA